MKAIPIFISALFCFCASWSKGDDTTVVSHRQHRPFIQHCTLATMSLGFIDYHRSFYKLPANFEKGNTSGYGSVYGRLEYGVSDKISIAATFSYDAFYYNFSQVYAGYYGINSKHFKIDHLRILSCGVSAFYHLNHLITVAHLDPFIGVGASINNIRHSALPQGDSTTVNIEHTVTPYIKLGARYYITDKFSLFADAGYDKQSIFSIGASCRFFGRR